MSSTILSSDRNVWTEYFNAAVEDGRVWRRSRIYQRPLQQQRFLAATAYGICWSTMAGTPFDSRLRRSKNAGEAYRELLSKIRVPVGCISGRPGRRSSDSPVERAAEDFIITESEIAVFIVSGTEVSGKRLEITPGNLLVNYRRRCRSIFLMLQAFTRPGLGAQIEYLLSHSGYARDNCACGYPAPHLLEWIGPNSPHLSAVSAAIMLRHLQEITSREFCRCKSRTTVWEKLF